MPTLVFRFSCPDVYRWAFHALQLGMWVHIALELAQGMRNMGATALLLAEVAAVLAVGALLLTAFPVSVRPDGLRGFDARGRYHTVRWDEAIEVRRSGRWLVVSDGRGTVLVSLDLPGLDRFARAVRAAAGDDHPLAVALREHGDIVSYARRPPVAPRPAAR